MPRQGGSKVNMIRSRFIRKSAKSGAKRKPKCILLLGSKNIGKTSLIKKFTSGNFIENYVPTVEERFAKDVDLNEYQLHTEIVDIDAFEFPAMRDLCVKEAHVLMLLYEFGNRKSFDILRKIYDAIKDVRDHPLPIVVVGTKADQSDKEKMTTGQTEGYVTEFLEELNSIMHSNSVRHMITSSKLDFNVTEAFHLGLEDLIKTMNAASLCHDTKNFSPESKGCCALI